MRLTEKEFKKIQLQPGYEIVVAKQHRTQPPTPKPAPQRSELEQLFKFYWQELGGPPLIEEYQFHPGRKWRADFVEKSSMVAIEIEGYGHQKANRYASDLDKYNEYSYMGWSLIRFTKAMITKDQVQRLIDYVRGRAG